MSQPDVAPTREPQVLFRVERRKGQRRLRAVVDDQKFVLRAQDIECPEVIVFQFEVVVPGGDDGDSQLATPWLYDLFPPWKR
jgi:hypothetical protein